MILDLLGRIVTNCESKFILVCVDHFGKWVETKILSNKSSKMIDKHGVPERILSDRSLEFKDSETVTSKAMGYQLEL